MPKYKAHVVSQGQRGRSQDRAAVFAHPEGVVLVVADGAGGTVLGEESAQATLSAIEAKLSQRQTLPDAKEWCALLQALDSRLAQQGGQTTAVVASVSSFGIQGASVGDSIAWLIEAHTYRDLTQHSPRKPLLGSGEASPAAFLDRELRGTLLLASDGLWRYASAQKICDITRRKSSALPEATEQLLALVRLPSGALQDDFSAVLCVCE